MASHALLARIFSILTWLLFAVVASLVAVMRFRRGKQAQHLSRSLVNALRPMDYAWALLAGVFLPFLLHQIVEHLTPFGGGNFSPGTTVIAEFSRSAAIAGLMLTLGNLMIVWRVTRRMKSLGWKRKLLPQAICSLAGLAVWVAACVCSFTGNDDDPDLSQGMFWLLGVLAIGAMLIPIRALFGRHERAVQWLVASRAMVPACVFAMLLMALAVPMNHAVEKYWTKRDTLTEIDPTVPARTRYDHEVQQALHAETLEFLRRKP